MVKIDTDCVPYYYSPNGKTLTLCLACGKAFTRIDVLTTKSADECMRLYDTLPVHDTFECATVEQSGKGTSLVVTFNDRVITYTFEHGTVTIHDAGNDGYVFDTTL